MDDSSRVAITLLEAMGRIDERLIDFSIEMDRRPEVASSAHDLECRKFKANGTQINGWVSVELRGGNAVGWNFGVEWDDDQWLITSAIGVNVTEWEETVKIFPDRTSNTLPDFLLQLDQAVSDLLANDDPAALIPS